MLRSRGEISPILQGFPGAFFRKQGNYIQALKSGLVLRNTREKLHPQQRRGAVAILGCRVPVF